MACFSRCWCGPRASMAGEIWSTVIIAGGRRYAALRQAIAVASDPALRGRLRRVPVLISGSEESATRVLQLIENLQREDLPPVEEARAQGADGPGGSGAWRGLAARVHRSLGYVEERLRLLRHEEVTEAVVDGVVTKSAGAAIASLPERIERQAWLDRARAGEAAQPSGLRQQEHGPRSAPTGHQRRRRAKGRRCGGTCPKFGQVCRSSYLRWCAVARATRRRMCVPARLRPANVRARSGVAYSPRCAVDPAEAGRGGGAAGRRCGTCWNLARPRGVVAPSCCHSCRDRSRRTSVSAFRLHKILTCAYTRWCVIQEGDALARR